MHEVEVKSIQAPWSFLFFFSLESKKRKPTQQHLSNSFEPWVNQETTFGFDRI